MKLPPERITSRQLEEWFAESGCVRRRFCPPKVPAPPAGNEASLPPERNGMVTDLTAKALSVSAPFTGANTSEKEAESP